MPFADHQPKHAQRILVIGGGRGGTALLELFLGDPMVEIVGVIDINPEAPALQLARQHALRCFTDLFEALQVCRPCMAFNLTADETVTQVAQHALGVENVIGGFAAHFLWQLLTKLKQAKEHAQHQALHDHLTGLANRLLFYDRVGQALARAQRTGSTFAVLYLDLDGFKHVNDAYGHAAGDAVLRQTAARITKCLRASDSAGRMGGDEFTVLLHDVATPQQTQRVAHCIVHALATPFDLGALSVRLSASVGVALYPQHGQTAEQLIKSADTAMYLAKNAGKNRVQVLPSPTAQTS